ncbi:PQQ-binding-like beta-propeller repeat protein [Undibacterium sp. Ji83W]|uniref:PQQ-binding-like beta-propeller repeat protein n=1 Tax=Undibacterium sp. Ji83W TaxID=3413043 RepID=UPI003BF14C3A
MTQTNWWMFHGDTAHTGEVQGSDISRDTLDQFKLLHDIAIPGPVLSVPAIVDGYLYVGLANNHELPGANGGKFMKIELSSGTTVAHYEWPIDPAEGDTHGFMGMGCTPAIWDNKVYFSAFNGKFYCLNATDLSLNWVVDLRHADPDFNQPTSNLGDVSVGVPAAGWSSPVIAATDGTNASGLVFVGMGEGENPGCFGFIYAMDAQTGQVQWIYCTCQYEEGVPNLPNVLPPESVSGTLPAMYSIGPNNPAIRGASVWSSIAYDERLDRLYCATGNPVPDSALPSKGFSNGILSLDASSGEFRGFSQPPAESSYRATDVDVDFGGSPTLMTINGRRIVTAGCKNGGFFRFDAATLELLNWRQLLPFYNDGTQIPTVDPHVSPNDQRMDPYVPNQESDEEDQENYSGTYSTAAVHTALGRLFIGVGGNNYHNVEAGIDYRTTPFMRALDWETLEDAWAMDDSDPRLYIESQPPMYRTPGESGLSSPVVVNDLVFFSTSKVAVYAFDVYSGKMLWHDDLGDQTGGMNGGYGYCLGPAVAGNYMVAGALVFGKQGGVLRIYGLKDKEDQHA